MNKSEELREEAFQYALGTLPEGSRRRFEARLVEDRELQSQVHEWQRINEEDAGDCEQLEPPFQAYASIMAEIDADGTASPAASVRSHSRSASFYAWGGWAVAACVTLFFGLVALRSPVERDTFAASDIVLGDLGNPEFVAAPSSGQEDELFQDRLLELTGLAEAYWFSREGLPPVDLEGGVDSEAFAGGFSIYDRKIKIGVIGIENIPESRLGRYYNVWARLSDDGDPVWAGMLKPGEAGSRLAFFDLSSNAEIQDGDQAISFFVTEEAEKRPERPVGPIVLSGI